MLAPLVRATALALAAALPAALLVAVDPLGDGATAAPAALGPVGGKSVGAFDLPVDPATPGSATGDLVNGAGAVVFTMDAVLSEVSTPALALRVGTLQGELDDGSGLAWPKYFVSGDWSALALTGTGTFTASIARQNSPLGPVFLIGEAVGAFRDLPAAPGAGVYVMRWRATL